MYNGCKKNFSYKMNLSQEKYANKRLSFLYRYRIQKNRYDVPTAEYFKELHYVYNYLSQKH